MARIYKPLFLKVESQSSLLYTVWLGDVCSIANNSTSDGVIEISGLYAAKQGFKDNDVVTATSIDNIPRCTIVHIQPESVDDWEIIEMNASLIEATLLNQLHLVAYDHVFPVWVQKSLCIFIRIGVMEPEHECCVLQTNTQVVVSPKIRTGSSSSVNTPSRFTSHLEPNASSIDAASANVSGENNTTVDADIAQTAASVSDDSYATTFSRAFEWMKKSFWTADSSSGCSDKVSAAVYRFEAWKPPEKFICPCRVLPLEDFSFTLNCPDRHFNLPQGCDAMTCNIPDDVSMDSWAFVRQPSCVYIGVQTVMKQLVIYDPSLIPGTFFAILENLECPASLKSSRQDQQKSKNLQDSSLSDGNKKTIVRVVVVDLNGHVMVNQKIFLGRMIDNGHILVSPILRRQLSISVKGRIILDMRVTANVLQPTILNCYPLGQLVKDFSSDMVKQAVVNYVESACSVQHPLIVTRSSFIQCFLTASAKIEYAVTFESPDSSDTVYCLLSPETLNATTFHVKTEPVLTDTSSSDSSQLHPANMPVTLDQLVLPDESIMAAVNHIDVSLCTNLLAQHIIGSSSGLRAGCLLIAGARGTGKTSFANALCNLASASPRYAHTQIINCVSLFGKRPETVRQVINNAIIEAVWHQPSVLLLDDLDEIAAASSGPDQEMSPEAMYHGRIAEELRFILKKGQEYNNTVCIIATCKSPAAVHKTLSSSRGQHFFPSIVHINSPTNEERRAMLQTFLGSQMNSLKVSYDDSLLSDIAKKTEGFVARDLRNIADRAVDGCFAVKKCLKNIGDEVTLTEDEFCWAMKDFKPSALRDVSLMAPGNLGWADIGGLHNVRKILEQTLLWPVKYPKLFASCPLKLRSGLLLYGAPGTGKTLLAGIIAKEYGLNFIAIKGPELLSKYIGASETAVRDTFTRAQAARPCILFFDEFESLAPRRGHDSTGVTDRVVNQLLTQLDGVESLEGVFILAATSRPDLIDPALLRPGRLDKALHCPLPSEDERLEILQVLSRHMNLSAEVDLRELAAASVQFTGADIKAMLYSAQIDALGEQRLDLTFVEDIGSESKDEDQQPIDIIHIPDLRKAPAALNRSEYEKISQKVERWLKKDSSSDQQSVSVPSHPPLVVTPQHLMAAIASTRPSVTPSERLRYQQIYDSFVTSRGGSVVSSGQTGQRVTLA